MPNLLGLGNSKEPVNDNNGFASKPTKEEAARGALMYDSPDPAKEPEAPAAGQLHRSTASQPIIERGPELWAKEGVTAETQIALRQKFVGIQRRTQLPDDLVARFASGYLDSLLVEEGDPTAADERVADLNTRVRAAFTDRHGDEAPARLAIVQKFVRADPAFAEVCRQGGEHTASVQLLLDLDSALFSRGYH